MQDLVVNAVAGRYEHQLLGCGFERGLDLFPRIILEAFDRDRAHLLIEALEPTKPVENAPAPEELIGIGWKLVAMGAEHKARVGTMIVEIACDDAGLQHATER